MFCSLRRGADVRCGLRGWDVFTLICQFCRASLWWLCTTWQGSNCGIQQGVVRSSRGEDCGCTCIHHSVVRNEGHLCLICCVCFVMLWAVSHCFIILNKCTYLFPTILIFTWILTDEKNSATLKFENGETSAIGLCRVCVCWDTCWREAFDILLVLGKDDPDSLWRGRIWLETPSSEVSGFNGVGGKATTLSWLSSNGGWQALSEN